MRALLLVAIAGFAVAARADTVIPGDRVQSRPPVGKPHDRDGDGIPDKKDHCPDEAEDRDGFEDDDGCPDPDNDQDRILDANDKCPNAPEIYNGLEDEDGCPDHVFRHNELAILDRIPFSPGSARIASSSNFVLNAIAASLKDSPEVRRIEISGHGDKRESPSLALARAEAVRRDLIERGVEPERLYTRGYGATKPGRYPSVYNVDVVNNRRVEFLVVEWQ